LNNSLNTLEMENVPASQFNARFGTETGDPANRAVSVLVAVL